ncbi:hypothetical protein SK128_015314 [Halocaridina rubra]|uniref:Methyltransferase FkbM domain-containing protein n=1 Tax=Halocaridina rubra TaxID=373956 RepID=A0AAN9A948_HALRR
MRNVCLVSRRVLNVFAFIIGVLGVFFLLKALYLTELENTELIYRIRGPVPADDHRLIDLLREEYLIPPSNKPYNISKDSDQVYTIYAKEDTWRFIHWQLQMLFDQAHRGFFVEAGALDGVFISNTLWLERNQGWTGLLVEPNKESFQHLQSKHRRSWTSNTCLSTEPYPKQTIQVNLKSAPRRGITPVSWNHRGSSHELGFNVNLSNPTFFAVADKSYAVVQCFPLISYLLALNVSVVDFLSLDVQGSERLILRSIPWDLVRIRVIIVEIYEEELDVDFKLYMESKGYILVNENLLPKVHDQIYIRIEEEELLRKLKYFVIV